MTTLKKCMTCDTEVESDAILTYCDECMRVAGEWARKAAIEAEKDTAIRIAEMNKHLKIKPKPYDDNFIQKCANEASDKIDRELDAALKDKPVASRNPVTDALVTGLFVGFLFCLIPSALIISTLFSKIPNQRDSNEQQKRVQEVHEGQVQQYEKGDVRK